jgi:hypothetical protein
LAFKGFLIGRKLKELKRVCDEDDDDDERSIIGIIEWEKMRTLQLN